MSYQRICEKCSGTLEDGVEHQCLAPLQLTTVEEYIRESVCSNLICAVAHTTVIRQRDLLRERGEQLARAAHEVQTLKIKINRMAALVVEIKKSISNTSLCAVKGDPAGATASATASDKAFEKLLMECTHFE